MERMVNDNVREGIWHGKNAICKKYTNRPAV
jgi:hypothetical protein